jgi:hypothetical protein
VLLRARGRRAVYDIVVYQDALLLSRASGPDPALIGAVVGALLASVVGAIVGAFIGEHVARSGASKRAHELLYAAPEYVFGRDRRNLFIRSADVRYARFRAYGTHQRVLDLRLRDGSRCHMRFDVRLQSNSFATEALRISLGPRMRVEHHGFRGASLLPGALVGVIALLSAWFVAAVVFGIAP